MITRVIAAFCLVAAPAAALAQDEKNGIEFRFGFGPASAPGYFGDDDTEAGVGFAVELERLRLGPIATDGTPSYGFGFNPSIRYIAERDADDFSELDGLDDIDASLELGGTLEFTDPNYEVFLSVRYGVIGHEAFVTEIGADLIYRPTDQLTVKAGPRVLFGDDSYSETYFGVSSDESSASGIDAFDPSAGLVSAGAIVEATYALNDDWEVIGTVEYAQFQDDAADSPITDSDEQIGASLVLTRRFTLGF